MRAAEFTQQLDEGPVWDEIKKKAAGAALATGIVGAAATQFGDKAKTNVPPSAAPQAAISQQYKEPEQTKLEKPVIKSTSQTANTKIQDSLAVTAISAGIEGEELAAFMAQMAHETLSFTSFVERGSEKYFKQMYDIKGKDPEKAKLLGNTKPGDGYKYRGRGYIHLTGKDNYAKAAKATGHDLVKKPELAADPYIAGEIAVWFWKQRIRPNVKDWSDTKAVTRRINPALQGLEDRDANFYDYKKKYRA